MPSVLFSGGEPLTRPDLFELIEYAGQQGMRAVISTNGTLITADIARKIKQKGVSYVGISLDGIGEVNDKFRGVSGAFDKAVQSIRNCQDVEVRTGLWRTMRPVIDHDRCNRCWWVCSTFCPDSAIQVNEEGYPEIDYDHCKGCLICAAKCPPHAIEAIAEHEAQKAAEESA